MQDRGLFKLKDQVSKMDKGMPWHPCQTRGRGMRAYSRLSYFCGAVADLAASYRGPCSLRTMKYLLYLFTFGLTSQSHVLADWGELASCTKSYALLHLKDLGIPTSPRFQSANAPFSDLLNTRQ